MRGRTELSGSDNDLQAVDLWPRSVSWERSRYCEGLLLSSR